MEKHVNSRSLFIFLGSWAALAASMTQTATGEHTLAIYIGQTDPWAWLFPVGVDVYASIAFALNRKRDVRISLLAMIFCNSVTHLIEAAHFQWWQVMLTILVSCIPPVICWRVHAMSANLPPIRTPRDTNPVLTGQPPTISTESPHSAPVSSAASAPSPRTGTNPAMFPAVAMPIAPTPLTPQDLRESAWKQHQPGECKVGADTHRSIEAIAVRNPHWTQPQIAHEVGVGPRTVQRCISERREFAPV